MLFLPRPFGLKQFLNLNLIEKKLSILFAIIALLASSTVVFAVKGVKGPWAVKMEGNGVIGSHSDVEEAVITWNFKWNGDSNWILGHLNIVEEVNDGSVRHFKLSAGQVDDVDGETTRPVLFICDTDEVRVEGENDEGQIVAAHFRGAKNLLYPNTVWYWVKNSVGSDITNTNARLTLSRPFTMECPE